SVFFSELSFHQFLYNLCVCSDIKGVDRRLTQGVLKRIIPAVASTNAVIAASCALEAIKLATNTAKPIDNYLNFTDIEGVYCGVVKMEKDPECPTCSGGYVQVQCNDDDTLQVFMDKLVDKFHLKNPSIETVNEKLYMINELLPELKDKSVSNLLRPLRELISAGEDLLVADEVLSKSLSIRVNFVT
ncbi:E2 binding domain protein, partial [Teladorsagia circumcincta]